jgi:hypothetical protein
MAVLVADGGIRDSAMCLPLALAGTGQYGAYYGYMQQKCAEAPRRAPAALPFASTTHYPLMPRVGQSSIGAEDWGRSGRW